MWIFTTDGFISAVYKENALQVRARDKKSLERLAKHTNSTIIKTYAVTPSSNHSTKSGMPCMM